MTTSTSTFQLLMEDLSNLSAGPSPIAGSALDELATRSKNSGSSDEVVEFLRSFPTTHEEFAAEFASLPSAGTIRDGLRRICRDYEAGDAPYRSRWGALTGVVGLILLTWYGLDRSEVLRSREDSGHVLDVDDAHTRAWCDELLRMDCVRLLLAGTYRSGVPDHPTGPTAASLTAWDSFVAAGGLTLHRFGTTSLVLRVQNGTHRTHVLKVLLIPHASALVVRSTRSYHDDFGALTSGRNHLVEVDGSGDLWVLMKFVSGVTLQELLDLPGVVRAKIAHPDLGFEDAVRLRVLQLLARKNRTSVEAERPGLVHEQFHALTARHRSLAPDEYETFEHEDARQLVLQLGLFGRAVFTALRAFEEAQSSTPGPLLQHEDLTPSNVIVDLGNTSDVEMTLIDYGRNHLHTRSVAGQQTRDLRYVAPEVRRNDADTSTADLYSLGQLLVSAGGMRARADGSVPDEAYVATPIVARLLEDLVQVRPIARLKVFEAGRSPMAGTITYHELEVHFRGELTAAEEAVDAGSFTAEKNFAASMADLRRPLTEAPARQVRLVRSLRRQVADGTRTRVGSAFALAIWSVVSAVGCAVAFILLVDYSYADLHAFLDETEIGVLQLLTRTSESVIANLVPWIGEQARPGYDVPDLGANWEARLVGLSYLFVSARYYQALFAGVTPVSGVRTWSDLRLLPAVAEFAMRWQTLAGPVLVLTVTIVDARWWAVCTAIGQTFAFLCNFFVAKFLEKTFARARAHGLSTVPADPQSITGYTNFYGWWKSSLYYGLMTWAVTVLLTWPVSLPEHWGGAGGLRLQDEWFYAVIVASLNFFLFFAVKCGTDAPAVRTALTRGCLAAERVARTPPPT